MARDRGYWDQAVNLAKKHNIKEIDSLLAKYATYLLEKDKILSAVELYHKANHFIEAAKLLIKVEKFRTVLKDTEKQQTTAKRGVLPLVDIYSLLALCSCAAGTFSLCSKALIKLESSKELSEDLRILYDQLSLQIFTRHHQGQGVGTHHLSIMWS
eukprot:Em0005g1336a